MPIALITGGTRGIGRAISNILGAQGIELIVNYSKDENAADKIKKDFPSSVLIKADLSISKGINNLCAPIKELDYLILNVGITDRTKFGDIEEEEWEKVFRTNLTIPFLLIQALREKINEKGKIIFISSVAGVVPDSVSIPYGVSKASVNMLVKYLAKEFAAKKITVNTIAPGYTMTNWHRDKPQDQVRRISEKTLLKRFAEPIEIAMIVEMLIKNDYITGQTICCDGGFGL